MPNTTEQRPALPATAAAPVQARTRRRPAWLWPAVAFALGLSACMALLLGRGSRDFFRASQAPASDSGREYAPLPAPGAVDGDEAIGLKREPTDDEPVSASVEDTPPPAPAPPPVVTRTAPRQFVQARPLPGRAPAPEYPAQALRRGEEGTVTVRVEVGPDGVPTSVSLVSGSGSRQLDRAAQDAVRRWRFEPARLDGRPTVSSVVVPIDFSRE